MSEFSRRPHYDDEPQSDEEDAVADSGTELSYRRLQVPASGGVETMHPPGFGGGFGGMSSSEQPGLGFAPKGPPPFDSETSGDSTGPLWSGAEEPSRSISAGYGRQTVTPAIPQSAYQRPSQNEQLKGYGSRSPPVASVNKGLENNESPFYSPFGNAATATTQGGEPGDSDTPCAITFPSTFRLERTNFVVSAVSPVAILSILAVLKAVRSALSGVGVDILEFKPAHCVLECSFHKGNCFLSLFVRVYRAPDRASGELIDTGNGNDQEQTPFLVEIQHREGDRLQFTSLFREIMREFKLQEGVNLAGTYRYHQRPYPAMGEGLALEAASMGPSRNSIRLLAEREEAINAVENNPAAGARRIVAEGGAPGAGLGVSPLPVPAGMSTTHPPLELDDDMMDDIVMLANMQRGEFLDVQANAATAVAGLTADPNLLEQLSRDEAARAAYDLAAASARLLVETEHRPARRQAAVVVANLSTTANLRAALLASDPAPPPGPYARRLGLKQLGLVERLVLLSMGVAVGPVAMPLEKKEEEIGMRRECMRALVALAECQAVRDTPAMKVLLSTEPSGRGANDDILIKRLRECRMVLKTRS